MQISPRLADKSFDLVTPGSRRGHCWSRKVVEVTSAGYLALEVQACQKSQISSSFKTFPEVGGIIYRNCCCELRNAH